MAEEKKKEEVTEKEKTTAKKTTAKTTTRKTTGGTAKKTTTKKATTKTTAEKKPAKKTTTTAKKTVKKATTAKVKKVEDVEDVEELDLETEEVTEPGKEAVVIETVEVEEENEPIKINESNKVIKEEQKLESIKEELDSKNKMSKKENASLNEIVFFNLGAAVLSISYFMFINNLYFKLAQDVFLRELKLFSFGFLLITLILFEVAHKKDSGKIALTSIEFLIFAVTSMLLVYVDTIFTIEFSVIVPVVGVAFAIYYLIKAIVQYVRKKKEFKLNNAKKAKEVDIEKD